MTKFEREQMSQLNRAMDRYRDALKKLVDSLDSEWGEPTLPDTRCALDAARNLLK